MIEDASLRRPALTPAQKPWARTTVVAVARVVSEAPVPAVRCALIVVALALQALSWYTPGRFRPTSDGVLAAVLMGTTVASLLFAALATLEVHRWPLELRRALVLTGALVAPVLLGVASSYIGDLGTATVLSSPYSNDGAVMDEYASSQLLVGHDPYRRVNFPYALQHNGLDLPATVSTPLMQGQLRDARYSYPSDDAINQALYNDQHYGPTRIPAEFESHYNYPALSFLLITPFVWAGVHDLRPLYLVFLAAIAAFVSWRAVGVWKYIAPTLVVLDVPLLALSRSGQPDPIYAFFLVVAWAEWRRSRVSGLALGLGIAAKQIAWFALPFYIVMVWRNAGWRAALDRLGIAGLVFAATNGPFFALDPLAYVHSLAAPMTDPMFPMGSGLIALSLAGVLPLLSRASYALSELGALLVCVGGYGLWLVRRYPAIGLVLASVPLLFAWRSLISYFYLTPLIALALSIRTMAPESAT